MKTLILGSGAMLLIILAILFIAVLFVRRCSHVNNQLRDEIIKLRCRLAYVSDRRSDSAHAVAMTVDDDVCVYIYETMNGTDMPTEICVKRFPKRNDPEYAQLCAEELAELINEEF